MSWQAVGVDVGGTKIAVARVEDGRVTVMDRRPTPHGGGQEVCEAVADAVALVHRPGLPVGVAMAGQVDPVRGVVRTSPNITGSDIRLGPHLQARFAAPVTVDNDVRMAGVGEWHAQDPAATVLVVLFVGTGIGSAAVVNGHPVAGAHNLALESGHSTFRPGGALCACGRRGCFEAYGGGRSIVERYLALTGGAAATLNAGDVAQRAGDGDAAAAEVWSEAVEAVRTLAWNLSVVFDPDVLVVGGGVAAGVPGLVEAVREHVHARVWPGFPPPRVVPGRDGTPLLGAAWWAAGRAAAGA